MKNEGGVNNHIHIAIIASALSMRLGLRALLTTDADILVVLEGSSQEDLEYHSTGLEIVLLAGRTVSALQLERLQRFLDPGVGILFLLEDALPPGFRTAIGLRAWGVLPLDSTGEELIAVVHALRAGLWVGSPELVNTLFPSDRTIFNTDNDDITEALSPRETEVLQLVAQGLANKQIAGLLQLSENTVKFHISSIYTKLRAGNRAEAVRIGARQGWISL